MVLFFCQNFVICICYVLYTLYDLMWCIAIVQSTPLHETTTLVALSTGLRSNCVRCKDAQMKTLGGVCINHTGTEKKNKIKKLKSNKLVK